MHDPTFVRRVSLRNYRSIGACDVQLGPLTFLVGPNGSGKSNFLDALRLIADALNNTLDHAIRERGGIHEVRRRAADQNGVHRHRAVGSRSCGVMSSGWWPAADRRYCSSWTKRRPRSERDCISIDHDCAAAVQSCTVMPRCWNSAMTSPPCCIDFSSSA
jgi:hypothetical protein